MAELVRSDSPMAKGLEGMLAQVDLQGLRSIASSLRDGMNCTISDKYTCGAYNLVYEIVFEDGISWIARLRSASPVQVISQEFVFESPTYKQHIMESEIVTMKYVRMHTTIPVPEIYAFDTASNNPAKLPYILMECIHGWRTPPRLQELPNEVLAKVLDQLANVLLQLSTLQFPNIGYLQEDADNGIRIDAMLDRKGRRVGPFASALEYYRWRADQPLNRSNDSLVDIQDARFHSYLYQLTLPFLMNGFRSNGPFPLAHNDLGVHNALFDDNWRLVGVIDWSGACVVPWESFAQFPGGVMMGPHLRHEFSESFYQYSGYKQRLFLECIKRQEQESLNQDGISVYSMLGTPITELAQCVELYDFAHLRRKYRRKLCSLLFGPEVDVEVMKRSILGSELFGGVASKNKNDHRKSFDFRMDNGDFGMGDKRNGTHIY